MADNPTRGDPPEPAPDPAPAADPTPAADLEAEVAKWKALSRQNEKAAKAAQAELDKARQASMSDQEKAVAQARAEGRAEASKETNRKLLHAEVRAAAGGLLADPDDAVHLLDLTPFETNDDPDRKAIRRALEQLVKDKPYLGAQPGNGSGEGGPRGGPPSSGKLENPLARTLAEAVGRKDLL
jgi:uncharacterized protein (DUF1501 family)